MGNRGNFGSKLGVILATAGSAVGLGNIWRFPYECGMGGGAAFILVYILCIIVLALPVMLCEFILGRHAQTNAARAFAKVAKHKVWKYVGLLGIITSFLILGYYIVVAGWTLEYLYTSVVGGFSSDSAQLTQFFTEFTSNPWKTIAVTIIFILMTHLVVSGGVEKGIERASKVMMPLLFILLIVMCVCTLTLPNASKGLNFLINPDFSQITPTVILGALGQSFFSLSVGMGILVTYASYYTPNTNLTKTALQICGIDTLVALLAGLIIFPAAFSVGISPDSGASLVFITLPEVFQQAFSSMPTLGYIVSILFYLLLILAALTSTISLHEVVTSFVKEELHLSRHKAATIVTLLVTIVACICAISSETFNFFDFFTANILLTIGGILLSVFVGWFIPRNVIVDQLSNGGTLKIYCLRLFIFTIRFICPICIMLIILHQFAVI